MSHAPLDVRYRRLLRCFPAHWREYREEEVLAVLMECASEEGRTRPSGAERWDLMRHGIAARVDSLATPASRRRTATLAACSGGALALGCLILGELVPWVGPYVGSHGVNSPVEPTKPGYGVVLYGLWLVALALTGVWRSRMARQLLIAVSILSLTGPWVAGSVGVSVPPLYFCVVLGVLAALAAVGDVSPRFGHTTADVSRGAGVVVAGAALMAVAARPYLFWRTGEPWYAFYRQWPVGLIGIGQASLWVIPLGSAILLACALALPRLRPWVGPWLVVAIPWMELALLAGMGNTARAGFPAAATLAAACALIGIGFLAGLRVTVRRPSSRAAQLDQGS